MILQWPSNGGEECGELSETAACSCDRGESTSAPCARFGADCEIGAWGAWSPCSATCGFSSSTRDRPVSTDARGDGQPCPPTTQARPCTIYECPTNETMCEGVDGVYANPSAACSARYITCDEGHLSWEACPHDLVFDPQRMRCATPHRVPECSALRAFRATVPLQ